MEIASLWYGEAALDRGDTFRKAMRLAWFCNADQERQIACARRAVEMRRAVRLYRDRRSDGHREGMPVFRRGPRLAESEGHRCLREMQGVISCAQDAETFRRHGRVTTKRRPVEGEPSGSLLSGRSRRRQLHCLDELYDILGPRGIRMSYR